MPDSPNDDVGADNDGDGQNHNHGYRRDHWRVHDDNEPNDLSVWPDDLYDGAVEFHGDIDIDTIVIYHRGTAYKLVPVNHHPHWGDDHVS